MNIINRAPINLLGHNFIDKQFIPKGKDEYHLRNSQQRKGVKYRNLTAEEINILIVNRNTADDWKQIYVSNGFNPQQVKNCQFYGLNRIGKLDSVYLEFHDLRMPVGLYNSVIISSDFGDNVSIDNVNCLSRYIIGNDVMIANVNEIASTQKAKFGNGIICDGEEEKNRVWMEVRNENGGRKIIPFDGMLAGDAYLWSTYRDDDALMNKFKEFTEKKFDSQRGYYGRIGDRTVIKNCKNIKDVNVGSDAYFKGANKLKNLTVNSDEKRTTQIGEGCELVNGIIGYGCRIFYGVKAVRFILASHSQLKYGARLLNSYLGNNSTISCCEVLNSLIFPAHEQHHNNSFLCASMIMGQSNMAAGATIGSNHNSRSADGEIIAGRGFWPGLCVSLKHNSKFASYTIIAKGDFPAEINIPIPFSLLINDTSKDKLVVMPGYWFMYNMYALARNTGKYLGRDKRTEKIQFIEYNYLAPDTVNEIFDAIKILSTLKTNEFDSAEITGWENTKRKTEIIKVSKSIEIFHALIQYYGMTEILKLIHTEKIKSFTELKKHLSTKISRSNWLNIGGQLIEKEAIDKVKKDIKSGKVKSWEELHTFYRKEGANYKKLKLQHAYTSLLEILNITSKQFDKKQFNSLLDKTIDTKSWICKGIYSSREKDYSSPFRKMVYESMQEMNMVIGKLEENTFIQEQLAELEVVKKQVTAIKKWKS